MSDKRKATGAATPVANGSETISLSNTETGNSLLIEGTIHRTPKSQGVGKRQKPARWAPEAALQEAEAWAAENPDAWDEIVRIALGKAEAEQRIGTQDLVETIRWRDYTSVTGKKTRINNNISPALARLLCMSYPQVMPYMDLRRSRFDTDGGDHD